MAEEKEVKLDSEEQAQEAELVEEVATESQTEPSAEEAGEATQSGEDAVAEVEVEDPEALRKELEQARAKEAEYLDGWQRARAELSNARKRFQREQQQAYANAKADLLIRLLPIVDDFERAFETLPDDLSSHTWVEGIKLVQHKAQGLLEQEGVAPIEAVGHQFDPSWHQAVTHEPSDEVPDGHVIAEMQRGYSMGDRVLRPCMVRVSAGAPPVPEPAEEPSPEEQTSSTEEESTRTEKS